MKSVLYIGNHLSSNGRYPSVAESMAPLLFPDIKLRLVSRYKNRFLRLLDMMAALIRHGRNEQPVIIDVYSTFNFYYALIISQLCRFYKLHFVCVLHGGNLPNRLDKYPGLSKLIFRHAMKLVAPSDYLKVSFELHGYKPICIPNFIPIENYQFQHRAKVKPNLLWVRAFDATYNPQMAIYVLNELVKEYPDSKLCMVGPNKDGSMDLCFDLAVKLGIKDNVLFTGQLSKSEWIQLSKEYDIFINTTNFDNTPVSVIEAMALGLPVVSTNVGGIPYLLVDGYDGLLVPAGDVTKMSALIIELIKNEQRHSKLTFNARRKVEGFCWQAIKPLWLSLFKVGKTNIA